MGALLWFVFGAVAGSVAKVVMPGPAAGGIPLGVCVGVSGVLFGGIAGSIVAGGLTLGVDVRSAFLAASSCMFFLICYRALALRYELQAGVAHAQR
jgi:uncharacterized membrane protein YeaQ/YmgE (transglycosylase-associated protein family)